MAEKEEKKKVTAVTAVTAAQDLNPRVRKQSKVVSYEWALNPVKLGHATTFVDSNSSGLSAEERHNAIKARYIEIKGRLPGEKRHKNGMLGTGTPRPSSEQAIRFDEGMDPASKVDEDEDDDEDDVDGLVEEAL